MKLMKKLMAALSVLCLVGMLAACGGGAGGGEGADGGKDNGGNPGGSTGSEYTIVYGDDTLETLTDEEFEDFSLFFDRMQDYTLDGKTIRLKTDGYTKYTVINTLTKMMENPQSIDPATLYTVVYDENGDGSFDEEEMVIMMPYSVLPGFTQMLGLSDQADYTIDETNKMIILTATGYQTGGEFFSMLFQEEADD